MAYCLRHRHNPQCVQGEAREADIGIAGGKGEGLLIRHGEIVRKIPESEFLSALTWELDHWNTES